MLNVAPLNFELKEKFIDNTFNVHQCDIVLAGIQVVTYSVSELDPRTNTSAYKAECFCDVEDEILDLGKFNNFDDASAACTRHWFELANRILSDLEYLSNKVYSEITGDSTS